jgi:2-oxoglutarate dehydrogenase E1 component
VAKTVLETFCKVPQGFHFHPKLQKWLEKRLDSIHETIDWATGECLAFGSLLMQAIPIRLAGQDSQRGTFSQRHMVWINTNTGEPYSPLSQLKTRIELVNSALTEYAGMGFEVGFSWESQNCLSLWEAQYGDFYNGAQIIVDQYLANAEQKWNCSSGLTLLLPHGYEGAGPEHSSARIERFLQLCACNNMQVIFPTTPAQYFHLLRRQALRKVKKPLIIFTPKSLLRSSDNTSKIEEFTKGKFEEILDDPSPPAKCKRLIFCSGKVFYGLMANRARDDIAIVRIEQLYPLNEHKLKEVLAKYRGFSECFWVQEEPENMGAWRYIRPFLPSAKYVGREENATTATGSNRKHKQDQQILLEKALK